MSMKMAIRMGKKGIRQRGRLRLRSILFGFVILLTIFIGIPYLFTRESKLEETGAEESLLPSTILNNKPEYEDKKLVMTGKISLAPVVCERRNCPADDSCCGCPDERDLLITDPGRILTTQTKEQLRLLDDKGQSFCERRPLSCDYTCRDWVEGAIYRLKGTFYTGPSPVGWKLSLDRYFEVEDKTLVRKAGFEEILETLIREIKAILGGISRPEFYILN